MKILLASYFYPPVEAVSAERWGRFSEQLAKRGHHVDVCAGPWLKDAGTVEKNGVTTHYLSDDFSEDSSKFIGDVKKKSKYRTLIERFLPLFILIDGKWSWSLRLFKHIFENRRKYELVIVTGTPWSAVVAGAMACRLVGLRYVLDFRDLWAAEPFLHFDSKAARYYFSLLEGWVAKSASAIFTVNEPLKDYFQKIAGKVPVETLANGYEGPLTHTTEEFNSLHNKEMHLLYAGTVSSHSGVPQFLRAFDLAQVPVDLAFLGIDHVGVLPHPHAIHLPHRSASEARTEIAKAAVLLLTLDERSENYITGKLMTYIQAGRPILFWGPLTSPAARLIERHRIGWTVANQDLDGLKKVLDQISSHLLSGEPFNFEPDFKALKIYSVESIVEKLEKSLLNSTRC